MERAQDRDSSKFLEPGYLAEDAALLAAQEAEKIKVSGTGQAQQGLGAATAAASMTYWFGVDGQYFTDGFSGGEAPVYLAYLSVAYLAAQSLLSICGRKVPKTVLTGMLNGASAGLGVAGAITGLVFGLVGDIATFGLCSLTGMGLGYLYSRRGKKIHAEPCGAKVPCDTWICPKCKFIISPTDDWVNKDYWDILDVCQYLHRGGLRLNAIQAIAFLQWAGLLEEAISLSGHRPVWRPHIIRNATTKQGTVEDFARKWAAFEGTHKVDSEEVDIEKLLLYWERFDFRGGPQEDGPPLSPTVDQNMM